MVKPNQLDLSPDIGWQWIVHNLDMGGSNFQGGLDTHARET